MDEFDKEQLESFTARVRDLRDLSRAASNHGDYATALSALQESFAWEREAIRIRVRAAIAEGNI